MDDNNGWHEPELAEETPLDIQGLADMKCHVCGGMGHMARNCPTPSNPKGGGKGGKAGGKGGKAGGPKGGKALGKGVRNAHLWCATCNKVGRLKDRCWLTYPDLRKKRKVQGVEEEVPMMAIQIGAVDTCGICDSLAHGPIRIKRALSRQPWRKTMSLSVTSLLRGATLPPVTSLLPVSPRT